DSPPAALAPWLLKRGWGRWVDCETKKSLGRLPGRYQDQGRKQSLRAVQHDPLPCRRGEWGELAGASAVEDPLYFQRKTIPSLPLRRLLHASLQMAWLEPPRVSVRAGQRGKRFADVEEVGRLGRFLIVDEIECSALLTDARIASLFQ